MPLCFLNRVSLYAAQKRPVPHVRPAAGARPHEAGELRVRKEVSALRVSVGGVNARCVLCLCFLRTWRKKAGGVGGLCLRLAPGASSAARAAAAPRRALIVLPRAAHTGWQPTSSRPDLKAGSSRATTAPARVPSSTMPAELTALDAAAPLTTARPPSPSVRSASNGTRSASPARTASTRLARSSARTRARHTATRASRSMLPRLPAPDAASWLWVTL